MAEGNVVGSAEFELRATKKRLDEDMKAVERDMKKSADRVEKEFARAGKGGADAFGDSMGQVSRDADGAAKGVGKASGLMMAGLAGVATAAAGISFSAIIDGARGAAKAGAELKDTADNLNIGVERLQALRYAADETKVPISALEGGLGRLNVLLGEFRAGMASRDLKPVFDKLGIRPEDLASIRDADQFMQLLSDRISQVGSKAEQAAIADKLQLGDLLPLLQLTADGINQVTDEAGKFGRILDQDLINKLAEADKQMQASAGQLDALRIAAFAPLAVVIGNASEAAAGFITQMEGIRSRAPAWAKTLAGAFNIVPGGQIIGNMILARSTGGSVDVPMDPDDPMLLRERMANSTPTGGYLPKPPRTPRSRASTAEAEQRQAQRLERMRVDMQASVDLLEARLGRDVERIAVLEREAEIRQRVRQLEDTGVKSDVARAEAMALQVRIDEARAEVKAREAAEAAEALVSAKRQHQIEVARLSGQNHIAAELERQEELADRIGFWESKGLDTDKARIAAKREMAELDDARATAAERNLAASQQQFDLELARARGDRKDMGRLGRAEDISRRADDIMRAGDGTISEADARRRAERDITALEEAVREGNVRDAFRYEFVEGMRAALDGDLGGFFDGLADRFTTRMLDNLADDLFDLISNATKGGGSSTNWISSIASVFGIGRNALGTSSWRGGLTTINEVGGELINLPRGAQVIPHDLSKRMVASAYEPQRVIHEVVVRPERDSFIALASNAAAPVAAQASEAAFTGARQTVPSDTAKTNRYTRGR